MCLFSSQMEYVADTRIFARADGDYQFLAYQMTVRNAQDAAMILPLPVPSGCREDAVQFVSLQDSYEFFRDLALLFVDIHAHQGKDWMIFSLPGLPSLAVHAVGEYEASFVPTLADFARLDPRFRLPPSVWSQLPMYADCGFAVFKLSLNPSPAKLTPLDLRIAAERKRDGKPPFPVRSREIHPMAFRFPRRDPGRLYFPTMHVHDGAWHPEASFDHLIYAQRRSAKMPLAPSDAGPAWRVSFRDANPDPKTAAAKLVRARQPMVRLELRGRFPNTDTFLADP